MSKIAENVDNSSFTSSEDANQTIVPTRETLRNSKPAAKPALKRDQKCNQGNKKNSITVQTKKTRPTRVVASRFQQAASIAGQSNKSSELRLSGRDSSGDSSGLSNSSLGNMRNKFGSRNCLLPNKNVVGCAKSTNDLHLSNRFRSGRLSLTPTGSPKLYLEAENRNKMNKQKKSNLHSTYLDGNTTIVERNSNAANASMFSTTMLSGLLGGKEPRKVKNSTVMLDNTLASLPEHPDISVIKLDGSNNNQSTESNSNRLQTLDECEIEMTKEELELQYLRYLTAACLDVSAESSYESQVRELEKETAMLHDLTVLKEQELLDLEQKMTLIEQYDAAIESYNQIKTLHENLSPDLKECNDAEVMLHEALENRQHQVQVENIFVDIDDDFYRENFIKSLGKIIESSQNLSSYLEPHKMSVDKSSELLSSLKDSYEEVQSKEKLINQTGGLAIQEASLLITESVKLIST